MSLTSQSSKVLLGQIASRQWGRVTWAQIKGLGIPRTTVTAWLRQGYLHRRLPGVYAVGHSSSSHEADIAAALLYAGPGAMLSHATAAWWLGLLDEPPRVIHVSTPRQCRSQPGIKVHQRRHCDRVRHNRLPTTTLPQTLLDLAATAPLRTVRRALAKADYAGSLDVQAVEAEIGPGRPGSVRLRRALTDHQPRLARTKSQNEVLFLEICEAAGLPMPETNVYIAGWEVDALWRDQRVAVEIDGYGNHRSPAQVRRDRRKEFTLRQHGLTPVRYSDEQLIEHRTDVVHELRRLL
jgi:predicted transcriptional regulator of viral defense system